MEKSEHEIAEQSQAQTDEQQLTERAKNHPSDTEVAERKNSITERELNYANVSVASPDSTTTIVVNMPAPPRFRRLRRFGRAFISMVLLFLIGSLVLAFFGDSGVVKLQQFINKAWLPATACRLLLYIGISWIVVPRMMQCVRMTALVRLEMQRQQLFEQGAADHYLLQEIEQDMARAMRAHISPWLAFIVLIILDLLLAQLPYWLA
ncbi:MAG: hypothetical protein Q4A74_02915 [Cardiobacteriaceae bacterium]|nr:hypothetical protein [Cardiobacteriaceae bacterium]